MRKLLTLLIALAAIVGAANGCRAAQALDGTGQSGNINTGGTGTNTFTIPLTTTSANDVVFVVIQGNSGASTSYSISGTGLSSIAQRGTDQVASGSRFAEFKAIAASTFSGNITVTINGWGGFGFFSAFAFAISGSNTSTVFDAGLSPPFVTTATAASGTTTNANDFVFAAYQDGVGTAGSGWTQILDGTSGFTVEYQIVSATGTYTGNLSPNNVNTVVGVLDAVIRATAGTSPCNRTLLGVGC